MPFNSLQYALFLAAATAACVACPRRLRWLLVLVASYYFYTRWNTGFVSVLAGSTILTYLVGLMAEGPRKDRRWLIVGLTANLSVLGLFKALSPSMGLLAPLGVSFFTLQAAGYLLQVFRGERAPERHLGVFAAYMSFFPHVVAGPIGRATEILPQFHGFETPTYERLSRGLRQVMWGLVQKVVIADNLAVFVDAVYDDVRIYAGFPLIIATLFFAVQLYCDFAGYSNVALGSARLLGVELAANFDRPYYAENLAVFWRRWHMSLSRWFADNVHSPLSFVLRARPRLGPVVSILVTFALCGLWHGMSWNYVVWGILHGVALSALAITRRPRRRLERLLPQGLHARLSVVITFAFICLTWVFFRANSLEDAAYVSLHLGAIDVGSLIGVPTISRGTFVRDIGFFLFGLFGERLAPQVDRGIARLGPSLSNYLCVVVLGLGLYVFGVFEKQSFIYSQF